MDQIQRPDFTLKNAISPDLIAQMVEKKKAQDSINAAQQQQNQAQQIQQTVQAASQMVGGMVAASKERQKQDFIKSNRQMLADTLAAQAGTTPNTDQSLASSTVGFGPQGNQAQFPTASFNQGSSDAMRSAVNLNPAAFTAQYAKQAFAQPQQLSTDKLLSKAIQSNDQPTVDKIKDAKSKPGDGLSPIFKGIGEDGKPHNFRTKKDGTKVDLGLATTGATGTKTINRKMADGSTHIMQVNSDGSQTDLGLAGSASANMPTSVTRSTAEFANTMLPHVTEMRNLIKVADAHGLIGPGAGRLNGQFLAGKVGTTGDPKADLILGRLRAEDSLFKSGAMKVHFGSKGGTQMYGTFSNLLNTGQQSAAQLNGALDGFDSFLRGYAGAGNHPQTSGKPSATGATDLGGGFSYSVKQ